MNCSEVKELLSGYYDCELSSDDRALVAAHLDDCADCSHALAGFERLSGLVQCLPTSVPPQLGWQHVHEQFTGPPRVEAAEQVTRAYRPNGPSWLRYRGLRPALAAAAILLVAVGWFALSTWIAPGSHDLLAADIQQYVTEFARDPETAQLLLVAKYDGQSLGQSAALKRVGYRPAAAGGLPEAYTVDSMYLLRMPCCDCLQTVCQRSDGSKFAIFEYGEEEPVSVGDRPGGMAQCRGENCCLVQINEQFAASWKKGDRHISIVGARDQAEIEDLSAWLN